MRVRVAPAPSFLGFDIAHASADEIRDYCERLIELNVILRSSEAFQIAISTEALATIYETSRYPSTAAIHGALLTSNLVGVYSASELVKPLNRLAQVGIEDGPFVASQVLVEDGYQITPNVIYGTDVPAITSADKDFLFCWAASQSAAKYQPGDILCCSLQRQNSIKVSGKLLGVVPSELCITEPSGFDLDETLTVNALHQTFVESLNAERLWQTAENSEQLFFAIFARAYAIHKQGGGSQHWSDFARFRVGADFISSLRSAKADGSAQYSKTTFETCARLVAGEPKYQVNHFIASNRSDGSTAFRTHITKHHEGLRLMFWKLPIGTIELANVGAKREELISHARADQAFVLYD